MRRRICVVSGSRADFGFLVWPMRLIQAAPSLQLQTIVTGSHLCPAFGRTQVDIEAAGFAIDARVDMLLAGDSAAAITKSVGVGIIGFADALARLAPDVVMLLGDRFETFAAATASVLAGLPIAHLAGGDTTEGAFDEQIRHAITKMAHLHFVTHEAAADRVRQMGEDPGRVFAVGSTGLDQIRRTPRMPAEQVFATIGLRPRRKNLVLAFHPVTLGETSSSEALDVVLGAIESLGPEVGIVICGSNADTEGASMNARLRSFAQGKSSVVFQPSFAHELFLSLLAAVDGIVGNSSCGLYEAPSFGIPTINVGDRQKGRLRASSVIDCPTEGKAIIQAITRGFAMDCRLVTNPYGDGHASERIVEQLCAMGDPRHLIVKRFHTTNVLDVAA